MLFSFSTCVFDTDQWLLTRAGQRVHLPPKALHLLELLILSRPRVIGREELHDALWPKTFVARTNLPSLIAQLRAAVGDRSPQPGLIRTVHAVGYAFIGEVTETPRALPSTATARGVKLCLILSEREVHLRQGVNLLGRAPHAAVRLDDEQVSRLHAQIVVEGHEATLEDLGSKNGTYLGSQRVDHRTPLLDGTVIWVGPFSMTFRMIGLSLTTQTAAHTG